MKRAIFGGSFDPPTKAHYELAVELSHRFDEVVVVPAYISPFKKAGSEVSGETRFNLLRELFSEYKNVTVSDIELKAKGTSYSYATAQALVKEGDELYFVIGSDGLGSLDRWARTDILKELVTFYVVERPFFPVKRSELDYVRTFLRVEIAPFIGEEGSSSLLKTAVAFGKEDEVVPGLVADYIRKNKLYRDYCYITERYAEFALKQSRIEHIYRTAKAAIILAKQNGADIEKTVTACLLHDIAKYVTRADFDRMGITYPQSADELPDSCVHQVTGAVIAKECFSVTDEDVLNAIATHTTGAKGMSLLQKIVFAADYIEEGRSFDGLDEIRKKLAADLDDGVLAIFENTIKYLTASGQALAKVTVEAYESLKQEKL